MFLLLGASIGSLIGAGIAALALLRPAGDSASTASDSDECRTVVAGSGRS